MDIIISILPVLLFLCFLIYLDSFKLVKKIHLIFCFLWGAFSALIAYYLNSSIIVFSKLDFYFYSRYVSPIIEELIKCIPLLYLILRSRVGFMIDGAILGFTIGTGFSLVENLYYLNTLQTDNLAIWIVRGFGTAIMHGGASSLFGIIAMKLSENVNIKYLFSGFILSVIVHSLYNHFILSPVISAVLLFFLLPIVIITVFQKNELSLRKWLEVEFDTEVRILRMIKDGVFSETKTGKYILSIKNRFSPDVVIDILCYIRIYIELSLRAKSNLLLKESGFPVNPDTEVDKKMKELKFLQKNVGRTGLLAISPVLRMSRKNIWKLNQLN